MTLSHRRLSLSTALLALVASACAESSPVAPLVRGDAVAFSRGGGRFSDFNPIAGSASCSAPPATLDAFASYQPFVLPEGYSSRIITMERDPGLFGLGKGVDNFDMLTLNETGRDAGRYLYRTHEVGSNGSLSVTDLKTGETRIVANAPHYEALDGIVWTPWGTVLFAEERIVASLRDPLVPDAVGGLVYEYNPRTGTTRPLPAVGARSHEGLRFDRRGNLYGISESTPGNPGQSGALFKFVPDRRGDLTRGQLYVLKVADGVSKTGRAEWVALDRAAVKINSDAEALRVGATGWARPEDIEITGAEGKRGDDDDDDRGGEVMYVATTTDALVLRIELDGRKAYVSDFIREGVNVTGMRNPDNLELDQNDNLYITEDNGPGDIWFTRANRGERIASSVVRFASLSDCEAEPTGIYFSANGKTLYVNVQHTGGALRNDLTVAITRD